MSAFRLPALVAALFIGAITACYAGKDVQNDDNGTPPSIVQSSNPTDPADAGFPPTCTSKMGWVGGDTGHKWMHPGMACIGCHNAAAADAGPPTDGGHHHGPPIFSVAGTIYGGAHDINDCNGVGDAPQIIITSADGTTQTLTANEVGNFYSKDPVVFPITAQVVTEAGVQTMHQPVKSGECNGCHTATSDDPTRIME